MNKYVHLSITFAASRHAASYVVALTVAAIFSLLLAGCGGPATSGDAPTRESSAPAFDATATRAAQVIAQALSGASGTHTPDAPASATVVAEQVATALAATLAAMLTATPIPPPLSTVTNVPPPATATATRPPTATPVLPTATPVPSLPPATACTAAAGPTFAGFYQGLDDLLGCPRSSQITVNTIAEQAFQGGHLFWRKDEDIVYMIYDRQVGGGELFQGSWDRSIDNSIGRYWSWAAAGEPDPNGVGLAPPPGLLEPVRGFGWFWRTHLGRENGPLGWALDREYGFDNVAQVQVFDNGIMFRGSDPKVYVLLYNGQFYATR